MRCSHPLSRLPSDVQRRVFWPLAILSSALLVVFQVIDRVLRSPAAPYGIVSLELAGSVPAAQAVLASWDAQAQLLAAFGLGLDYLFIPIYSTAIALGCLIAAGVLRRGAWPVAGLGCALAWSLWIAALLDAAENVALMNILLGTVSAPWPQAAALFSAIKFVLIGLGLAYSSYGLMGALALTRSGRT